MKLIEDNGHHYFVVGDRRWLATGVFREDHPNVLSGITRDNWFRSRGCRVRFETGWEVSIIWGNLTYSSNRSMRMGFGPIEDEPEFSEEPTAVEIGVLAHDGEWADTEECVMGWVTEQELTKLLHLLAELPTNATFSYDMIREE